MATTAETLADWLDQAGISADRLTEPQQAVLTAAFCFRHKQGSDYYSTRLLSHFLLHADTGLKVAAIARLVGISRPTASAQQGIPSKDVIRSAAHRLAGRPYGKLLPRHAGPVAAFLLGHPDATRLDVVRFLNDTLAVKVSRVALHKFLKKYGLNHLGQPAPLPVPLARPTDVGTADSPPAAAIAAAATDPPGPLEVPAAATQLPPPLPSPLPARILLPQPQVVPATLAAPPFSSGGRSMPAPSC